MANFADALRGSLSPEVLDQLTALADDREYGVLTEDVSSGAIAVDRRTSRVSVTGTTAYTLADGTREGQVKVLTCVAATSTPAGTVTPDNFADGTSITLDAVNETVTLQWNSADGWRVLALNGATVS